MESFIRSYGYLAIFVGTFIEGETVLVVGGFLAERTYLDLPWVIVVAFLGTLLGDQTYYYLGRIKGIEFLEKRPRWKRKSARARNLLHRHQTLVVLGFRFLYGVRTVVPFLIGVSKVPKFRFFVLNAVGISVWATAVGVAGYLLGRAVELFIDDVKLYELWILGLVVVGSLVAWVLWWRLEKRRGLQGDGNGS